MQPSAAVRMQGLLQEVMAIAQPSMAERIEGVLQELRASPVQERLDGGETCV